METKKQKAVKLDRLAVKYRRLAGELMFNDRPRVAEDCPAAADNLKTAHDALCRAFQALEDARDKVAA